MTPKQDGDKKFLFLSSSTVKQATLSLCISLSYFCIGLVRGFSSPAVPSILQINPEIFPTKAAASWTSSIPPLGAFFGSLIAGPLMQKFGRKYTVMLTSPLWTIAWILIATSKTWKIMIIGRILSGFCAGLAIPSAQIYVSECSNPEIRGVLGSFPAMSMSLGILFSYVLGKSVPWTQLAWCNCVIAASFLFLLLIFPESPVWLKTKGRAIQANKSIKWLELSMDHIVIDEKFVKPKIFSRKILFSRPILYPMGIGLALLSIQQLSGIDAIIFFTVEIFQTAGSSVDENVASIIVGLVQVLSNFASLFIVDKAGRKPLLISSAIIMSISNAFMGVAFYLNGIGNNQFGFIPVASLITFMIGFSIGFGCIPFLLLGELFPTEQRSLLSSLAGSINLLIMFIVIKTYHPLEYLITTAGTFWMYAGLCALGVFFVIFFVPETKGRDLESIAKLFEKPEKIEKLGGVANLGLEAHGDCLKAKRPSDSNKPTKYDTKM